MGTKSARVRFGPHWLEIMFILVGVINGTVTKGNPTYIDDRGPERTRDDKYVGESGIGHLGPTPVN